MIPFVCKDRFLTEEENKKILDFCSGLTLEQGRAGKVLESDLRKSNVSFFKRDKSSEWIFEKINLLVRESNFYFYNFNITGYNFIQYAEYDSRYFGRYDWHMDMSLKKERTTTERKLSVSILLNEPEIDFEGGEFEITDSFNTNLKKNSAIIFPSFLYHRVNTVTKGIRKSLVVWAEGPSFT
jgi:PKHD-type hydroxylase